LYSWNIPGVQTPKVSEDAYEKDEEFVDMVSEISKDVSRFGLHHESFGNFAPELLAFFWSIIPLCRRAYRNTRRVSLMCATTSNATSSLAVVKDNNAHFDELWWFDKIKNIYEHLNSEVASSSWLGSSTSWLSTSKFNTTGTDTNLTDATNSFVTWDTIDQITVFVCLVGVSGVLASTVARVLTVFLKTCCQKSNSDDCDEKNNPIYKFIARKYKKAVLRVTHTFPGFASIFRILFLIFGLLVPLFFISVTRKNRQCPSDEINKTELNGGLTGLFSSPSIVVFVVQVLIVDFFYSWQIIIYKCGASKLSQYLRNMKPGAAATLAVLIPSVISLAVTAVRVYMNIYFDMEQKPPPKSMRMVLMWSSFALTFTLTSTFLSVMHRSYQYFANLAEQFRIFTKASTHASWYQFYREFANKNSVIEHNSNNRKKIEKLVRQAESFDLTDGKDLARWDKSRDILVMKLTSGITTVNEINLTMMTVLTATLLVISSLASYLRLLKNVKNNQDENTLNSMARDVAAIEDIQSKNSYELGWFFCICLVFLAPMLYSRYQVTKQDKIQLDILKNTKKKVEINGIENDLDGNPEAKEQTQSQINIMFDHIMFVSRSKLDLYKYLESLNLIEHFDRLVADGVECTKDLIHVSEEYLMDDLGIGKIKTKKILAKIGGKKMKDTVERLNIIIEKVEDTGDILRPTIFGGDIIPLMKTIFIGLVVQVLGAYLDQKTDGSSSILDKLNN
jgi:hypothetical protein